MAWNIAVLTALLLALGYIGFLHYRAHQRERTLARTDDLTRIDNRRAFYEIASREFERARRYRRPFTPAYCDVDDFKEVNTRFGRHVGAGILCMVAETSRPSIRTSALVPPGAGEEF